MNAITVAPATLLVAARELSALARSALAWTTVAGALLGEGLYFYAVGVAGVGGAKAPSDILLGFFDAASAAVMVVALLLGMRTIARERERGTMVLLSTAPIGDGAIVMGKFAASLSVIGLLQLLSLYMPALVFAESRVAAGRIAVGYLGVLLLGGAVLAIATLASAIARTQASAAALGGAIVAVLLLAWLLGKAVDPPWSDVLDAIALHHRHQRPFMRGELRGEHVVFYVALIVTSLVAASRAVGAKRWS